MPAQPEQNSLGEKEQTPAQTSTQPSTGTKGMGVAKPDLEMLRWRAEVLLDEMMLGGVDFAANGQVSVSTPLARPVTPDVEAPPSFPRREGANGEHTTDAHHQNGAYAGSTPAVPTRSRYPADADQNALRMGASSEQMTFAPQPTSQINEGPQPWVASAEERYRRLASPQPATAQPAGADGYGNRDTPDAEEIWQGGEHLHPLDTNGHHVSYQESDLSTVASSTVRRAAPQYAHASASSLGANGRRSNLLPRLSTADVEAMQQEIFTLQNEIDHILPSGHDSNKRVRHLLERAQAILQQDPMRSAEVEYYLQQVRTIFHHVQQTVDWSGIYRSRLFIYLTAWILLSAIVLIACYLYHGLIENFIVAIGALAPNSLILQHFLATVAIFFAGTFGGALGTLANLQHQNRLPYGFIDRKFGLRGLILPILGGIVGLLCYIPIGLLFYLFGLNPSQNILLSVFPVLLSFIYGVSQESIYGTRE